MAVSEIWTSQGRGFLQAESQIISFLSAGRTSTAAMGAQPLPNASAALGPVARAAASPTLLGNPAYFWVALCHVVPPLLDIPSH